MVVDKGPREMLTEGGELQQTDDDVRNNDLALRVLFCLGRKLWRGKLLISAWRPCQAFQGGDFTGSGAQGLQRGWAVSTVGGREISIECPSNLKDYFMQTSRKHRIPYILCRQSNSIYHQHDRSCKPRTEQQR